MKLVSSVILILLIFLVFIFNIQPTSELAEIIDTRAGSIIIVVVALCMFAYSRILGIFGLLLAFILIQRSALVTGNAALQLFYPYDEKQKWVGLPRIHEFPVTLEEQMVAKYGTATME